LEKSSDAQQIKNIADKLVKAWERAEVSCIDHIVLENAFIHFTMFGRDIGRQALKEAFAARTRKTSFVKFEIVNYVCLIEKGKAQQSFGLIGAFADQEEGEWKRFGFEGIFVNSLTETENGWKFSSVKFEYSNEDSIQWPRLYSTGIDQIPGRGDISFVANWKNPHHDDRIGWHEGTEIPVVNAEYDAPWYVIQNRENPGTDEEQIRETYFRYAFGIDFYSFQLYEDVFTEDAVMIYGDEQPYDKRSVVDMLKSERQGSCRCVHWAIFKNIDIHGDTADAKMYLRGCVIPDHYQIDEKSLNKRIGWARYKLNYKKIDGKWLIHRMIFYPGFVEF